MSAGLPSPTYLLPERKAAQSELLNVLKNNHLVFHHRQQKGKQEHSVQTKDGLRSFQVFGKTGTHWTSAATTGEDQHQEPERVQCLKIINKMLLTLLVIPFL